MAAFRVQHTSGMHELQGVAVQQAIVSGPAGNPQLAQRIDLAQGLPQHHTVHVIRSTTQTFVLPPTGGKVILTQLPGQTTTPTDIGTRNLKAPRATAAGQPSIQETMVTLSGASQPTSAQGAGNTSPGSCQQAIIFQPFPLGKPQQQMEPQLQSGTRQEHRTAVIASDVRYPTGLRPASPAFAAPTFTARACCAADSPYSHMHNADNMAYPSPPCPWYSSQKHELPAVGLGLFSPDMMRRDARSAFSQPVLVPGNVGHPSSSPSFTTAVEAENAPSAKSIPEPTQMLTSASAPALDRLATATASFSYSSSSRSAEDEVERSTDPLWQTYPVEDWEKSRPYSTDLILPKEARYTMNLPKGLRRLPDREQVIVYIVVLVVAIAGLIGAISVYSRRRWAREQEERSFEPEESAKMFGPWQILDNGNVTRNANRSCTTMQYSQKPLSVIRTLDRSVTPCDNFYGYACSSDWKLRGSYASVGTGDIERAVVAFFKGSSHATHDVAASRQFWRDCTDAETITLLGKHPFEGILNVIGLQDWPFAARDSRSDVLNAWRAAGNVMRHLSLSPLLHLELMAHQGTTEMVITRGHDIPFTLQELSKGTARDTLTGDATKAIQVIHGAGFKHNGVAQEVVDFVSKLSSLGDDSEVVRRVTPPTSITPFVTSALNETEFLPRNGTLFIMQSSKFVDALIHLVNTTPSRVVINYLGFCVVRHAFLFTPTCVKGILHASKRSPVAAIREKGCVRVLLNDALPKTVAEHVSYAALRKNIDLPALHTLLMDVKKSLINRISKLHWLDARTQQHAANRLKGVEIRFFFENSLMSMSQTLNGTWNHLPDVIPSQALLSYQRLRAYRFKSSFANVPERFSNRSGSFAHSDCTYYAGHNVLLLPLATLNVKGTSSPFSLLFQAPRFGAKLLRCLLYVLLGGNTEGHGKTSSADEHCWGVATRRHYESIRSCLDKQYLRTQNSVESKTADGRNFLSTLNVIDNALTGPAKDVYDIYARALRPPGTSPENEAVEGVTWEQLFYVLYTQGMCDQGLQGETTLHDSPYSERVNIPLGSDDGFMKAFKCGEKSAMRREPRCRIWS